MPGDVLYHLRWELPLWLVGLATNWLPDNRYTLRLRGALSRPFIGKCGRRLELGAHVYLTNTHNLTVGDDVYIARGCWLNCMAGLALEDEAVLAPYVVISTLQHTFKDGSVRFGGCTSAPVTIGRGAWLAAHVSVRCGTTVGEGCLIGANSCVTKDIPAHAFAGGVPARVLGEVHDAEAALFSRADFMRNAGGDEDPRRARCAAETCHPGPHL